MKLAQIMWKTKIYGTVASKLNVLHTFELKRLVKYAVNALQWRLVHLPVKVKDSSGAFPLLPLSVVSLMGYCRYPAGRADDNT